MVHTIRSPFAQHQLVDLVPVRMHDSEHKEWDSDGKYEKTHRRKQNMPHALLATVTRQCQLGSEIKLVSDLITPAQNTRMLFSSNAAEQRSLNPF